MRQRSSTVDSQAQEPNVAFLADVYDQFVKGGIGAIIHLWGDDAVWHIQGRNGPLARDWHGKYGVNDFFRQLLDMCLGTFELEVRDILANRERAVVFVHERARRDGVLYEVDTVHVWRIVDGTLAEFWRYAPDIDRDDEFWS